MENNNSQKNVRVVVMKNLSTQLGVEPDDLHDEDSLKEDLHLKAVDLTDLLDHLQNEGLDTSEVDFEEIETLGELIEILKDEEEI